jgi:hypothetical protein
MHDRFRLKGILERIELPGIAGLSKERDAIRQSRKRLIALLFLFDAVLIVATLLSLQKAELIEEELTLLETKEVYDILYQEQVFTQTIVVTEIIPYGSVP